MAAIFEKLNHTADETISYLLDEIFLDLDWWFQQLITKAWMTSNESLDTIVVTFEDYTQVRFRIIVRKDYTQVGFNDIHTEAKYKVWRRISFRIPPYSQFSCINYQLLNCFENLRGI